MPTNSTTGVGTAYTNEQLSQASRTINNELGKDAFLKLLIAELSNQDPMNPMSDREFIAQMAQFSSLEQMTNLNKTLDNMASLEKYSAVNYLGTDVFFTPEGSEDGKGAYGRVLAVWYDPTDGPMLEIDGYGNLPLYKVEGVSYIDTGTAVPPDGSEGTEG